MSSTSQSKALTPMENNTVAEFKVPIGRPPRKKKKVLDEETYIKKLSMIIERDFFPDLDHLKDKLEFIEAKESNDYTKLREIYEKYSVNTEAGRGYRVEDSPATFETPEHNPSQSKNTHSQENDKTKKTGKLESKDDLPSLDTFMQTHTSEDNENFEQLMEEARQRIKLKNPWLFEAEDKHNTQHAPNLSLPSIKEQTEQARLAITGISDKDKDTRPSSIENWRYKTFNSVMYPPEGAPPSTAQKLKNAKASNKEVIHLNTRYEANPFRETVSQATMLEASAIQASKKEGKVGIDGKELSKENPLLNGYSYVPNPSPVPGVDASPLMTWGEVEGTPFQLDGSNTPLVNHSPAPSYHIPKAPDRDELVLKLVEKANQNNKDKKTKALTAARSYFGTPLSKLGTPSSIDRMSCMSPAAQRLLKVKTRIGSDRSLRASYTPRLRSTPSRYDTTPGAITPSSVRTPAKLLAQSPKLTGSLTDNLLQLPRNKDKKEKNEYWCKASDFF